MTDPSNAAKASYISTVQDPARSPLDGQLARVRHASDALEATIDQLTERLHPVSAPYPTGLATLESKDKPSCAPLTYAVGDQADRIEKLNDRLISLMQSLDI